MAMDPMEPPQPTEPHPTEAQPTESWPTMPGVEEWPVARQMRQSQRRSSARHRLLAVLAALAFLVAPALVGYQLGRDDGDGVAADSASVTVPRGDSQSPNGDGGASSPESSGSGSATDLQAVADAVDDVVVNIMTTLEGGGEAAGTGIVISPSGLVLTNNHVIAGSTGLTVEFATSGVTRSAKVLGYSVVDDVALIQVQNVNNAPAAKIGSSSSLVVGETILSLGNAGGRGGSPTIVAGTVTGLGHEITASDADGTNAQTLDNLIQLAAAIRSGDSGGPVVDTTGTVVGMNVAASVSNGFSFPGRSSGEGYAIPIEEAVSIAKRISSGDGGTDIRVGATRAVLGVQVQPQLMSGGRGPRGGGVSGAAVVGVEAGSGADKAGLAAGDLITALGGRTIATSSDLTRTLVAYDPGDSVEITWRDASGTTRRGTVKLGEGPPA